MRSWWSTVKAESGRLSKSPGWVAFATSAWTSCTPGLLSGVAGVSVTDDRREVISLSGGAPLPW